MKAIIILLMCLLLADLHAQRLKVTQVITDVPKTGPFYFLPATAVTIEIPIKRVAKEKGRLSAYAALIGLSQTEIITADVITNSVDYSGIAIGTTAIFDKNYVYKVDVKKRFLRKNSASLEFLESGFLKGADVSSESNAIPLITTIVGSVAKVVGAFVSPTKMIDSKEISADNAEAIELAKKLSDLRKLKTSFITTPFAGDAPALQKQLDAIDAEEAAIVEVFAGTTTTGIIKQKFQIIPQDNKTVPLFSYGTAGFTPIWIDSLHVWNTKFPGGGGNTVSVKFAARNAHTAHIKNNPASTDDGFRYRIPAPGVVTIQEGTTAKFTSEVVVSQFGPVVTLPSKLNTATLEFFTNGAISKLLLTTNSGSVENIQKIADTVTDLHDQFKKKEPEEANELADLERQRKILEEKVKIDELSKKLSGN